MQKYWKIVIVSHRYNYGTTRHVTTRKVTDDDACRCSRLMDQSSEKQTRATLDCRPRDQKGIFSWLRAWKTQGKLMKNSLSLSLSPFGKGRQLQTNTHTQTHTLTNWDAGKRSPVRSGPPWGQDNAGCVKCEMLEASRKCEVPSKCASSKYLADWWQPCIATLLPVAVHLWSQKSCEKLRK